MDSRVITRPALSITQIQVESEQNLLKLFYNGIKLKKTKDAYTNQDTKKMLARLWE